jgi:hypothetical protein
MMNSIPDKAAQVAQTTVEALKQTPMILALVIFNILFMFLSVYASIKMGARWDAEIARMHELVAKVMASCGSFQR